MTLEAILSEVPLFSQLPGESLIELVAAGRTVSFEGGQVVCEEGENVSDAMYVVLDGRLRVFKHDVEGHEVDIATLEPGEFFGEMAILDRGPRSATVLCLTDCQLFELDRTAFMSLLDHAESHAVLFSIVSALIERVRSTSESYFEEELAQRTIQAQMEVERHRSLAQLVAGVAHELNTPLGVANTAVDIIATRVQSEVLAVPASGDPAAQRAMADVHEAADLALRNIDRAHQLVESFKKISVNHLTTRRETIDLPTLVHEIVELFSINARQAKLQIDVSNQLPTGRSTWSGYPGLLTQVLTNLLFNIERHAYPHHNGGRITIGLTLDPDSAAFVLSVQDSGQGIEPENLDRIFDPFFTTGRSQGGTGLGLAIVHSIVTEELGGTIRVDSALNEGATFTVTFPQTVNDTPTREQ
jgi:signal transduction histidine kinase